MLPAGQGAPSNQNKQLHRWVKITSSRGPASMEVRQALTPRRGITHANYLLQMRPPGVNLRVV